MDATNCTSITVSYVIVKDVTNENGRGTGLVLRDLRGKVAVSLRESIGSCPVSEKDTVSFILFNNRGRMDWILQNPVHFCNNSKENIFVFGSVLLTQSERCRIGLDVDVGVVGDGDND